MFTHQCIFNHTSGQWDKCNICALIPKIHLQDYKRNPFAHPARGVKNIIYLSILLTPSYIVKRCGNMLKPFCGCWQ